MLEALEDAVMLAIFADIHAQPARRSRRALLIERVKLDLIVVLARMQGIEIGDAVHPSTTASPSITNWLCLFFSAASTIRG